MSLLQRMTLSPSTHLFSLHPLYTSWEINRSTCCIHLTFSLSGNLQIAAWFCSCLPTALIIPPIVAPNVQFLQNEYILALLILHISRLVSMTAAPAPTCQSIMYCSLDSNSSNTACPACPAAEGNLHSEFCTCVHRDLLKAPGISWGNQNEQDQRWGCFSSLPSQIDPSFGCGCPLCPLSCDVLAVGVVKNFARTTIHWRSCLAGLRGFSPNRVPLLALIGIGLCIDSKSPQGQHSWAQPECRARKTRVHRVHAGCAVRDVGGVRGRHPIGHGLKLVHCEDPSFSPPAPSCQTGPSTSQDRGSVHVAVLESAMQSSSGNT